jgi:hypothetical protein
VLKAVFEVFGKGIHESLTRTMGNYLEVTGGRLANSNKSAWEKDIAARMICTNNPAEGPFATVRAFLHMYPRSGNPDPYAHPKPNPNPNPYPNPYPSMKLKTVAALSAAIVNGTHRAAHKVGKTTVPAGFAITAAPALQQAVSTLCGVRRRNPGLNA